MLSAAFVAKTLPIARLERRNVTQNQNTGLIISFEIADPLRRPAGTAFCPQPPACPFPVAPLGLGRAAQPQVRHGFAAAIPMDNPYCIRKLPTLCTPSKAIPMENPYCSCKGGAADETARKGRLSPFFLL